MTRRWVWVLAAVVTGVELFAWSIAALAGQQSNALRPPAFQVDPTWPTIPNNWVLGEVSSIAVDSRDHIWVLHRPRSIPEAQRANAAPPVLEFDTAGKLLASWGGSADGYDWPEREHGIFVDAKGFVWISGNGGWPKPSAPGSGDDMILKFTTAGKLVLQIGHRGQSKGNTDTVNVHQPADVFVHAPTNELYVADGYGNQRVVVFDADSGQFKRMWSAFGNAPPAEMAPNPPAPVPNQGGPDGPPQFGLVHAVKVSNDGIVYVADRTNNRIQAFTTAGKFSDRCVSRRRHRDAGSGRLCLLTRREAAVPLCRRFRADADRDLRSRAADADRHAWACAARSRASSTSCITWPPTRRAISTLRRSSPIAALRGS